MSISCLKLVRKRCITGYKSNYLSEKEKVTLYRPPSNWGERQRWMKAIPKENVPNSPNTVFCVKHFTPSFPVLKIKGPRKYFKVVSTLLLDWYDVVTSQNFKQHWKNSVYVNVEIYSVEQRRINVVYFNVDLNNVRQHQHLTMTIFVNMKIWKKIKIKPRFKYKIILWSFKEYTGVKIFFILFCILRGICKRRFEGLQNS